MEIEKAKAHARRLEAFLKEQGVKLPYSACLEAIARAEGVANWQTLEAKRHERAITVSAKHLSGAPAANFFELPFMHPESDWPLIKTVLVADNQREMQLGIRTYHDIHSVNEEMLELLSKEANGAKLDEDDLNCLEDAGDEILIDWGDENEGEGLSVNDLRGIKQIGDSTWLLEDGRELELFALGKVVAPLPNQKDKRKKPKAN